MNNVIRHIEYLIARRDCVVIPSIGAFIVRHRSAYYDEVTGVMYPPQREVSFNSDVNQSDGLLVSSVARRQQISFEKASLIVGQEIEAMKSQLKSDGELSMGRLGRFIYQEESSIMFEPSANVSRSATYLAPISIKPIIDVVKNDSIAGSVAHSHQRSRFGLVARRVMRVAASLVALVGVGILLSTPVFFDRDDSLASVSVQSVRPTQTAVLPQMTNESNSLKIFIPEESPVEIQPIAVESVTFDVKPSVSTAFTQSRRLDQNDRYCLIVASLPTESLALEFIRDNGDIDLKMLSQDGKFRVYAATGATSGQAYGQRSIDKISERFPDAWVCRRH